ncbi:cellulase family glycosylhydrolase [Pontibacter beigongshangensis]|uniref:cellulase family glycosylhydrolase n=1 Tax=Pontibacter beigongshangensis TaxID=2574733 RepID=UPI00164FC340|nr:cellulase family glycosylhydrolase [Pontibacter beigongshangensis]
MMKTLICSLVLLVCLGFSARAQEAETTHVWEFDAPVVNKKSEGWEAINYSNPNTVDGILHLTADAGLGYPDLEYKLQPGDVIDPAVSKQIVIRLKNGTSSRRCRFYWVKNGVQVRHDFLVSVQDTEFKEYVIDLSHDSRWSGTLQSIRFEIPMPVPSNSTGTIVSIDYIKLLKAPAAPAPMPAITPAPFGVNLAGGDFANDDYQYPHAAELDYFKEKGLTLMRIPFKWERLQPELNGAFSERDLNDLRNIVWAARTRGIWVLLDMHNYGRRKVNDVTTVIGNPGVSVADAANAWRMIAEEFKDFGNIYAYGLMNEPYGMTKHTPWVNIAQGMIDAIRTVDTHTPIMVGGESYSSAARWQTESDNLRGLVDPADDLIFEAHVYFDNDASGSYSKSYDEEKASPTTGVNRLKPFVDWLKKYNLRGFVGEYGIPDNDVRWLTVLDQTLAYMKENNLNGTYWAAGSRWGTHKMSVHPNNNGSDRLQMQVLEKYHYADAPAPQPQITSPYAANYNVNSNVSYQLKATNNPTSFTVTGLPAGLTYNSSSNLITGIMPDGVHTVQLSATNASGTGNIREVELRGMRLTLPGVVEAEHYNDGGNNVGYFDTTVGNSGNAAYRHDDVDLRTTATPGNFAVNTTASGEWLKYTVNVEQEGSYSVKLRYATSTADASGVVNFKLNGAALTADATLEPTTNRDTWQEASLELPVLAAGVHTLELHVVSEGFDIDRFTFRVNTAPDAPAGLTAAAFGSSKVQLNWSAVEGAASYTLKRAATENGTYEVIAQGLTDTSYEDENLAPETSYYYMVSGTNLVGEGPNSAMVSVTTAAFTIPAAVEGLSGVTGENLVTLSWTAMPDVASYNIKRAVVSGGGYEVVGTTAEPAFVDGTVTNGTTYYYVVSATNALGEGSNSHEFAATPGSGRVGYWAFNETSGSTATDIWSSQVATLEAEASFAAGRQGNALSLTGTAASYAKLPEGIVSTLDDFTISGWVRPSANTNWGRLFDFGNSTSYMYLVPRNGTDGRVRYSIRNGSAPAQQINCAITLSTNTWVHIAVTLSGNVGIMYINGREVGRNNNMTLKPSDLGFTENNYIGKSQFPNDPNFRGLIDEFRIYSKALSPEDIQGLLNPTFEQSITFSPLPQKEVGDPDFALTAAASSGLPVTYASSHPEVATVEDGMVKIVGAGTTTITASQAGNANYEAAAAVSQVLTVVQKWQEISFAPLEEKLLGAADFALAATASSGLPVLYESSNPAVATVVEGLVQLVGAGTTTITATQPGNNVYAPAAPVSQELTVSQKAQFITFASLPEVSLGEPDFSISAIASSGLPVVFSSSNPAVATVTNGIVSIKGAGTTVITATQAGNNEYGPAPDVAHTLVVASDTQAPTVPQQLTADKTNKHKVALAWQPSNDNIAVTGYDVYQNGVKLVTLPATATSYLTERPFGRDVYVFFVKAFDAAGNVSAASNRVASSNGPYDEQLLTIYDGTETISHTATAALKIGTEGFETYPNPTQGRVNVSVNNLQDGAITISVYNTAGGLVQQFTDVKQGAYQKELNLEHLVAGMYHIRVSVGNFSQAKSILKR